MVASVVVVEKATNLEAVGAEHLRDRETIAVGCEGVEMGLPGGQLTLVEVGTRDTCFLFDLLDLQRPDDPVWQVPAMALLKDLLEAGGIEKIIHDCKWASDALANQCNITLCNVHDTSAWHSVLSAGDGLHLASLNDALIANGCEPIVPINRGAHAEASSCWAVRPITAEMRAWAAQHVEALFALQAAQLKTATPPEVARCNFESAENVVRFRDGFFQVVRVHPSQMGQLIGKRGSHIRTLEAETGAFVATHSGPPPTAIVHARSKEAVASAVSALHKFTRPARPVYPSPLPHGVDDDDDMYGPREYGFGDRFDYSDDYAEDWYYRYSGEA